MKDNKIICINSEYIVSIETITKKYTYIACEKIIITEIKIYLSNGHTVDITDPPPYFIDDLEKISGNLLD